MPLGDALSCPTRMGTGTCRNSNCDCPKQDAVPTKVWFVSGKAANKAFREGRLQSLYREDATLSENKENIPPDEQTKDAQHDQSQKA